MKKLGIALIGTLLVVGVGLGLFWLVSQEDAPEAEPVARFSLSEEMYGQGEFREITAEEFARLVAERKSFVVVVHMVICPAEFPVTSIAKQLAHEDDLVIYGLTEEEFKQTELAQKIKYLPSVAIYHAGELVAYLDAESDEDLPYYQTIGGLRQWLRTYIDK